MRKTVIGISNVDRSSQVFTLFERLPVQKDRTLFKTLNSKIVYPVKDPESHTLFYGTYPYRTNKRVPPLPPGELETFMSMFSHRSITGKMKNPKKNFTER